MNSHPEWLNKALIYYVYLPSFFDSNKDGIGDLKGLQKKLDYIKDLGFNTILLSPIFDSPFFVSGYDIKDFEKVAKRYGTNNDAYTLFKMAHEKGMRVILSLSIAYTSYQHPWFSKASLAKENEFSNRYLYSDSIDHTPKDLPYIKGYGERDGVFVTSARSSLAPSLNYGYSQVKADYEEPLEGKGPLSTMDAIKEILSFWLSKGVDGFAFKDTTDAVKRDPSGEGNVSLYKEIITSLKNDYADSVYLSDWDNPLCSLRASFDADMLLPDTKNPYNGLLARGLTPYFRFSDGKKDAKSFFDNFRPLYTYATSQQKFLSLLSGDSEIQRVASSLDKEETKFFLLFLFSMPSLPILYYGDELGMKKEENLVSVDGGYSATGNRTPMLWDKSKNAGFTSASKPYIKISTERKDLSVEEEKDDADSLSSFLKAFLALRKDHVAFDNDASFELVETKSFCPIVFIRKKFAEKLLIAINPSSRTYKISLGDFKGNPLFSSGQAYVEDGALKLAKESFMVLE